MGLLYLINSFDSLKVGGTEVDKHNQTRWSIFQSLLYQQAMAHILDSLSHAAHWGTEIQCANGILRQIYPFIFGLIADNQERYVALLKGSWHTSITFLAGPCWQCAEAKHSNHVLFATSQGKHCTDLMWNILNIPGQKHVKSSKRPK